MSIDRLSPVQDDPAGARQAPSSFLSAHGSRYMWVVLALAVTTQTAGSVISQGIYTLVPFWKSAFGLSPALASLAVSALNGGQILSMLGLGRAIDRHGERLVLSLTLIAAALTAFAAAAFASTYPVLLLLILILGAFYASVQTGGTRAILRWFPPERRGLATGCRQAAVPLGTALAALILPSLAAWRGWPLAVAAQGVIGIFGGVVFWLLYRENAGGAAGRAPVSSPPKIRDLVKALGRDTPFWPVLVAGIAMSAFQFTFTAYAILFMADRLGLPIVAGAALFAVAQLVGIPSRILLPWLSDLLWPGSRIRSLGWIMLACVLAAALFAFLPKGAPHWALVLSLVPIGVFGIGWFPLFILEIAETAPKNATASTISFAWMLCMIAMSLAPFAFGLVADSLNYGTAWALLIVPVFVTAIPLCKIEKTMLGRCAVRT